MSGDGPAAAEPSATGHDDRPGVPWYVKAALIATLITVAVVVLVDVLAVAGAF